MDGIIVIDKPKGCTSHDIVQKVKRICHEKVGHTGTLDPMATGVLPLLIGKGTLCSKYLMNHDKIYQVELTLGKKTDTADSEGTVLEERMVPKEILQKPNVQKILTSFIGKQQQIPPIYSAIKVKGKKLYEYARKGEMVSIPPREVEIYKIQLQKILLEERKIQFEVHSSKGTYIRSLCEDIAEKLGTVGYMSELRRIQVGEFNLQNAISMEDLTEKIQENFIRIEEMFQQKPKIELDTKRRDLLLNGVQLTQKQEDGIYRIYHEHCFIGLGIIQDQLLKRDIIL